jgi:hypothetical protein
MLRWFMDPFKARRENMCVMLEQACQQAKREYDNPQATSMSPDSRHALVAEKPVIVFDRVIFDLMKEPELLNKKVYLRLLKLDKQIFGVPFYHNVTHSLLSVYPLEIAQRIECRGADFPSVYTWTEWFFKSMKSNEAHASHGRPDLYGKRKELEESISNLLSIISSLICQSIGR